MKLITIQAALLVSLAFTSQLMAQAVVPLKIDLPKPMFVGTPRTINSANLEPARNGQPRPPVMVPADVANVAEDKPVTSSDSYPIIGDLELITDGDKEGADGSYVELGPSKQWIQIDLEEPREIYAIVVWHFHSQARVYHDVIAQVADDADFITNVRTVFNTDHDNSAGMGIGTDKEYIETNEGRPFAVKGEKAQFVRLYSNGSTSSEMNHYIEVEVYGK